MTDTKHTPTPGPWKIARREVLEDGSIYPTHILGGPKDLQVCPLESSVVAELAVKNPSERWGISEADACLIAAAPDMLTALETVLAGGHLNTGEQAIVANAIAKATGKSIDEVLRIGG